MSKTKSRFKGFRKQWKPGPVIVERPVGRVRDVVEDVPHKALRWLGKQPKVVLDQLTPAQMLDVISVVRAR